MQTACWKVLMYYLKACYWAASQDVHVYFHWRSSKQVMTVYVILTNCLLIITIFENVLNGNKYWQNTKQHVTKRKKNETYTYNVLHIWNFETIVSIFHRYKWMCNERYLMWFWYSLC